MCTHTFLCIFICMCININVCAYLHIHITTTQIKIERIHWFLSPQITPTRNPKLFFTFFKPFSSVQLLSHVQLCATHGLQHAQAFLSITNSQSLPKLMCITSVMPSNPLILCCPFLLPPLIFPSIRVFSMSWLFASGNPMDCGRPNSSVLGDSPGMNTEVGSHFLLQGIFLTQGSNPCLLTSPGLAGRFFTSRAPWETLNFQPHLQRVTTVSFLFF